MNLQESIRRILREETEPGKYTKAVQVIVDDFKNEDFVCDLDVSYYNEMYEIAVKIDRKEFEKKYESLHLDYANILMKGYLDRLKRTIRQEIKNFLPVDVLVWFKQINCDKGLNESEDDKEKKIQKNLRVINELINMFEYSEVCDMWVDYHYEDDDYIIRSKMSTKNHNTAALEKEFEFLEDSIESLGFTNCYVFRPYYVENCEDENELNESEDDKEKKIQKNLKAIRILLDTIDVDGLCEMWVEYNPEDGDYEIRSKTTKKYLDMADMVRELGYIDDTIRSWGMKTYVYTPWYVENCEDEIEFLNESEEKKGKYINALEDLTEDFKNEDCVCDIEIEYRPEEFRDAYLITVVLGNRDLDDKFNGISWRISDYRTKLKRKITNGVMEFLPIPFYIEFKQTPKCYKDLQESEKKKPRLLSTIEEDGLFQVMQDTGLSLPQIYTKTGELPREVLEGYIKDFIKQEGYPSWMNGTLVLIFAVEIQKNIQIENFYLEGDKVTVEISGYNDYGEQTDGYIESLSNLSDDEILTIVENMINWFTSSEM